MLPPTIRDITNYNLRNRNNINIPSSRLEIHKQSFIPSSVQLWNNVDPNIRALDTHNKFKTNIIKTIYTNYNIPQHFLNGDRFLSVMHARIRNKCSNLNNDLYNNHLRENPYCICADVLETAEHYFFQCPIFEHKRPFLLQSLQMFLPLTVTDLLQGKPELSYPDNCEIFTTVQMYIKFTKRFKR